MGIDIYSTLNDLLQGKAQALDGISLLGELGLAKKEQQGRAGNDKQAEKNREKVARREAIFWYFPAYVEGENPDASDRYFQQRPVAAIRKSDWKLLLYLDSDRIELYNLALDSGEQNNVAKYQPAIVKELTKALRQWLKKNGVAAPLKNNPAFDEAFAAQYSRSFFDRWIEWFSHLVK